MITEDYVSFETAKLLKEKGFDDFTCHSYYYKNGDIEEETRYEGDFGRPTLQMAMKWLREKHNLHIGVLVTYQYLPRKYEVHIMHTVKSEDIAINTGTNFNTNKEACEEAIKYCLENLI